MGRNQREYVLRQQLKAIKEELGELDEGGGDLDEFKDKIREAKMPPDVEKVAMKQFERLKVMQPSSGWARPRAASPSPGPRGAISSASAWAACATRPRSAATAAPTSARSPAASSRA